MQALRILAKCLGSLATPEHYLFAPADLRSLVPSLSDAAFRSMLTRAVASGVLDRVCRGIYLASHVAHASGLVLYHAAARLRAGHLLYLSLESALSEHGLISQMPLGRITLMTTGRGGAINCGVRGVIEFTHTKRRANRFCGQLSYDPARRLWVAAPKLALRDLRRVGRNLDLVQAVTEVEEQ